VVKRSASAADIQNKLNEGLANSKPTPPHKIGLCHTGLRSC
jgi:hypothetical protein